jgi:hypothetical protein
VNADFSAFSFRIMLLRTGSFDDERNKAGPAMRAIL